MSTNRTGPIFAMLLMMTAAAGMGCRSGAQSASEQPAHDAEHHEGGAQPPDASEPQVKVTTSLDRTAVWVGDPIVWTVEIICPPNFGIIEEDLAPEKVVLEGLELVSAETDRATTDDGSLIHRVRYYLRSYDIGSPVLRTQPATPLKVRYYVQLPGQRAEDLAPAGEVLVPGATIAWRSTLPDNLERVGVRPDRLPDALPAILSIARPAGLTLMLLSAVPVALWAFSRIQQVQVPRHRRPSARATRSKTLSALSRLKEADTSTPVALQQAYDQLDEALRSHVAATAQVPAAALAASEFEHRVTVSHGRLSGSAVAEVLAECARARYARPEGMPSGEQFRASVEAAERLL